jgi:hypothetical protein
VATASMVNRKLAETSSLHPFRSMVTLEDLHSLTVH